MKSPHPPQPAHVLPFTPQPTSEPKPFKVSPLALQQMASQLMSAQEIQDALEREGQPVEGEVRGRHGRK